MTLSRIFVVAALFFAPIVPLAGQPTQPVNVPAPSVPKKKGKCNETGVPSNSSFNWSLSLGHARYGKPDGLGDLSRIANERDGSLPMFKELLERTFTPDPLQRGEVYIEIQEPQIGPFTILPSCLSIDAEGAFEVIRVNGPVVGGVFIHQVLTDDRFTQVDFLTAPEKGWRLRVWNRSAAALTKSNGVYVATGFTAVTPLTDVKVKYPDGETVSDTLLFIRKDATGIVGTRTVTNEIVQTYGFIGKPATLVSKVYSGEGTTGPLLSQENLTYSDRTSRAWHYTIVREVFTASVNAAGTIGPLVRTAKSREVYRDYSPNITQNSSGTFTENLEGGSPGMKRLISRIDAYDVPGQSPQETTHTYMDLGITAGVGTAANPAVHGRLESTVNPDGSWIYNEYSLSMNSPVSVITSYSGWKDLPLTSRISARKTVTIVTGNESVEKRYVAGNLIGESKTTSAPGSTERLLKTEKRDGNTWHTTTTAYFGENVGAPSTGRIKWVENTDGTAVTYTYAMVNGKLVVTTRSGAGSRSGVTAGTEVKTTFGLGDIAISEVTKDIASNLVTEQWDTDLSYHGGFDQSGRPIKRIYNADMSDYDVNQYACCGLEFSRDRMGATTTYFRDGLKRVYKVEDKACAASPVVATFTAVDGLTTTRTRSIAGQSLFIGSSTRSIDGLIRTTVGPSEKSTLAEDRTTTSKVITRSATGDIETTTYADLATSITANYLDGQTKSVTGTAVADMSYTYDTYPIAGSVPQAHGLTTTQTATGIVSTTFIDLLGRTSKINSAATGTTNYAYHPLSAAAGSRTQLKSVTDGDNVTLTYDYNAEGQRTTTSRSIPIANGATATQVTTTEQDVVSDMTLHGTSLGIARRNTQTISSTGIDPVTISQTFISQDGLTRGSVSLSGATLSETTRPDATSGIATQITIHPDGTKSKATKHHDLLTTAATLKTDNSVITSTNYAYDPLQRLLTSTDARIGLTTYDLDADGLADVTESGRPLAVKTPANHTTSYAYDSLGRVITLDAPDTLDASGATLANISYTAYYPTGSVKATWGSQTYPTWNVYDEQNRQIRLHTWKVAPTFTLASVPENPPAGSEVTSWIYGPTTGHLVEKNYPGETDDGATDADYAYTSGGRLFTRTSERGITTTYGYTHGLMTSTDYSDATPDVTIHYEPLGRQQSVSTSVAKSEFTYDPVTLATDIEAISYNLDAVAGYDFYRILDRKSTSLGRDTGWELKNGPTIENEAGYQFSSITGRLESVTNSADVFTYGYLNNSGLLQTVTKAARAGNPAFVAARGYEATRDTLASTQNKVGTDVVSNYEYAVNAIDQRTGVTTSGSAFPGFPSWLWGYDHLGQVVSANSSVSTSDRAYEYDAIGNRKKSANSLTLSGTDNYSSNALNQYTAVDTLSPAYDFDGNATAYPLPVAPSALSGLGWDGENRMISSTVGTTTTTYLYDARSRRIAKSTAGSSNIYFYHTWNCIAEYTQSAPTAPVVLAKTRLWGTDLSGTAQGAGGVGGLLAEDHHSGTAATFYPTYDGNGNVSEYLAVDGRPAAHFEYDPFGNTVVASGSAGLFDYRFSTKPRDSETGLYYYGYRYYDPVTGRWPSRDPIEEKGGMNLYGFVRNDGVNLVDLKGLTGWAFNYPSDWSDNNSGPGANDGIPRMDDHLRGSYEPYDNLGENDWWEENQAELIAKHKQNAKNEISAQVDCDTKPTQVDGYSQSESPTGQRLLFGTVGFVVDSKVTVSWDGCDWKWTATLNIEDKLGVDHTDSIPETILTIFGFPLIAPPTPVIRGSWEISGEGTCPE